MTELAEQRVLHFTRELLRLETVNPPGREQEAAITVARRLEAAGFVVKVETFSAGRANVVARSPRAGATTQCWTGHLDTVPLGEAPWAVHPFAGHVDGGKVYGRGSSDMKGGVAAMVAAVEQVTATSSPPRGLSLVFTGGEETGCEGALALAANNAHLPTPDVLLVGEPTANRPVLGHKGVLWLELSTTGRAAHASRPEDGVNAVDRLVDALVQLRTFHLGEPDGFLGKPTCSVGTVAGGVGVNLVPDRAAARVDLRTLPGADHDALLRDLSGRLGPTVDVRVLTSLPAIRTQQDDVRVAPVLDVVAAVVGGAATTGGMTYFTDASVLSAAMNNPATVLCGPGEPGQAHVTDEWCGIQRLEEAVEIYARLASEVE